jgi:COP9 signalosome complex subunit 3
MAGHLVDSLLSFQPDSPELQPRREYDKAAREFVSNISNIAPSHYLKGADTTNDVLDVSSRRGSGGGCLLTLAQILDPTANSMAYAVALRIRISAAMERKSMEQLQPGNRLWNKLATFLENFDSVQMRYGGHEWRKLVDYVEQMARVAGTVRL